MQKQVEQPKTYWRVEGSLLNFSAVRPVGFFTWNAQRFTERWFRRGALTAVTLMRPLLFAADRRFATRSIYSVLRGVSRDRLDALGEEYFEYILKPKLNRASVDLLRKLVSENHEVVLVSHSLTHIIQPLASYLGVNSIVANRLDFRNGVATGRLLDPVIRPRGGLARIIDQRDDGRISQELLLKKLGFRGRPQRLQEAEVPTDRWVPVPSKPVVLFKSSNQVKDFSVRRSLAGKQLLMMGASGFVGKAWVADVLDKVPNMGKLYLLLRKSRAQSAVQRFEKMVSEATVFDRLAQKHEMDLGQFIRERVEIIQGDISEPNLGLDDATYERLTRDIDIVVNCSGNTNFNADLQSAVNTNIHGPLNVVNFVRNCEKASLLHVSTCFTAGSVNGRIPEQVIPNYTPLGIEGFDAQQELTALEEIIEEAKALSESDEVTEELRQTALNRGTRPGRAIEKVVGKMRARWLQNYLIEAGSQRAKDLGWPNTYCFSKSLAESLIHELAGDLQVAIVRPAIVETSLRAPFKGWNEGINTSAPLSHLLSTTFRQLPSNERKCLDVIPVDWVCQGMTMVCAALAEGCHQELYQLATSGSNPCDMKRSIELTGLAHRKHYRKHKGIKPWLRSICDTIPVSKKRYELLSAPKQKAILQRINQVLSPMKLKQRVINRLENGLDRVERLIELYEPFILHNELFFETDHIEMLSVSLPVDEREDFGVHPHDNDWWEYWINIHTPALRKWSYPLLEGQSVPRQNKRPFSMSEPSVVLEETDDQAACLSS